VADLKRWAKTKKMSWNLLIYRQGESEEMLPLGSLAAVTAAMNTAFPDLEWLSPDECALKVDRGFIIEWKLQGDDVQDGYTNGGFDHLKQLAALCKQEGWRIADAQEGEDIDLDDPYASFGSGGDE